MRIDTQVHNGILELANIPTRNPLTALAWHSTSVRQNRKNMLM